VRYASRLIIGRFVAEAPGLDSQRHTELILRAAREAAYLRCPPQLDPQELHEDGEMANQIRAQVIPPTLRSSIGPGEVAASIAHAVLEEVRV
jgi:hypothetical protein